jgi:hypothetical protein
MNDFAFYFTLGWKHIISMDAFDHILFIVALAAVYLVRDVKQVLVLVTAFTIGHSLTLALCVNDIIRFPSKLVEFLIPLTVVITAGLNIFTKNTFIGKMGYRYLIALFFGLIHGMGFANSIRFMLYKKETIFKPLLGFNLGLEVGQILVVTVILLMSYLFISKVRLHQRYWILMLSAIAFGVGIFMCFQRFPFNGRV